MVSVPFIFLFREPAADSHLELGEGRVSSHIVQKQQKLSEDGHARFLQVIRMSSLLSNVSLYTSDA